MPERIVSLQKPITTSYSIESLEVRALSVNIRDRKATAALIVNGKEVPLLLWEGDAYDACGITNFWPTVEARVKELVAGGLPT